MANATQHIIGAVAGGHRRGRLREERHIRAHLHTVTGADESVRETETRAHAEQRPSCAGAGGGGGTTWAETAAADAARECGGAAAAAERRRTRRRSARSAGGEGETTDSSRRVRSAVRHSRAPPRDGAADVAAEVEAIAGDHRGGRLLVKLLRRSTPVKRREKTFRPKGGTKGGLFISRKQNF